MPGLGAINGDIFPRRARQPSASRPGGDAGEAKEEIKTPPPNKLLLGLKKTRRLTGAPPARLALRAGFPGAEIAIGKFFPQNRGALGCFVWLGCS